MQSLAEMPGLIVGLHLALAYFAHILLRNLIAIFMPASDAHVVVRKYRLGDAGQGILKSSKVLYSDFV